MALLEKPPNAARLAADALDPAPDPWLENPVGFIANRLEETAWSKQREIAESVRDHPRTAVPSCFGAGKSFIAARIACWWIHCHPPGTAKVVTTAAGAEQVRSILWQEIGKAHAKGKLIGQVNQTEWWVPQMGRDIIVGLGRRPPNWNPVPLQGHHADHVLVIIDEAAGVPEGFYDALNGLVIGPQDRTLAIGNPWQPTHKFGQICKPNSGWNTIRISAYDTPAFTGEPYRGTLITPEWVQNLENDIGRDDPRFISKVLAQFPETAADSLFNLSWIEAAQERSMKPGKPFEMGVDVADEGKDSSVIYMRAGGKVRLHSTWKAPGVMATVGHIVRAWREHTTLDAIKVDTQPPGVVARAKEIEPMMPIIGLGFGASPYDKNRFRNAKAEWYWHLKELFEDGMIDISPADDELVRQLMTIKVDWKKSGSNGQIVMESKADMARRGEASPDRVDALAYAMAPVGVGQFKVFTEERVLRHRGRGSRRQVIGEGNLLDEEEVGF